MNKALVCVLVFSLSAVMHVSGGDKKNDLKIDGSWTATGGIADGKKLPAELFEKDVQVVVFKDGKYTETFMGKETEAGTYKIDTTKNPHTIDFDVTEGKAKGKVQLGLIKIDGDVMTIALADHGSKDRPKDFEGTGDNGVIILKRNK
jgi:uncharacterized protein (TIGR03067 family)